MMTNNNLSMQEKLAFIKDALFNKANKLLQKTDSAVTNPSESSRRLIIFITLFFVAVILNIGYKSNPLFIDDFFDGSNTINISSLSISDINSVISKEQNFPLYYYILHYIMAMTGKGFVSVYFFNAGVWLISLVVFHQTVKYFIKEPFWRSVALLIYTATSNIAYYSYFPRMYGLINLFILVIIFLNQKYLEKEKPIYLSWTIITLTILSALHPTAGFVIFLTYLTYLLIIRKIRDGMLITIGSVIPSLFLALQIVAKNNWQDIYLQRGLNYIVGQRSSYLYFLHDLLFRNESAFSFIILVVLFISLVAIVRFYRHKNRELIVLYVWFAFFIVYCFTQHQFINFHHYIFLVTPLVLVIGMGLENIHIKYKGIFALCIIFFYISQGFLNIFTEYSISISTKDLCRKTSSISNSTIVTDYSSYNFYSRCINPSDNEIIILYKDSFEVARKMTALDIINNQAKYGGNIFLITLSILPKDSTSFDIPSFKKFLKNNKLESRSVYLGNAVLPRYQFNEYEMKIMSGCSLEDNIDQTLFRFNCE